MSPAEGDDRFEVCTVFVPRCPVERPRSALGMTGDPHMVKIHPVKQQRIFHPVECKEGDHALFRAVPLAGPALLRADHNEPPRGEMPEDTRIF